MHPTDIGTLLAELTDEGFLKRDSKGRWTTYTLNVETKFQPSLFDMTRKEAPVSEGEQVGVQVEDPVQHQVQEQVKQNEQVGVQPDVQVDVQVGVQVGEQVQKLLEALGNQSLSRGELMNILHEESRMRFFRVYLTPALDLGLIEMMLPEKRNSSKQQYRRVMKKQN